MGAMVERFVTPINQMPTRPVKANLDAPPDDQTTTTGLATGDTLAFDIGPNAELRLRRVGWRVPAAAFGDAMILLRTRCADLIKAAGLLQQRPTRQAGYMHADRFNINNRRLQ